MEIHKFIYNFVLEIVNKFANKFTKNFPKLYKNSHKNNKKRLKMEIIYTNRQKKRKNMLDNLKKDYEQLKKEYPNEKKNRLFCTLAEKYGYKTPMTIISAIKKMGIE